MVRRPEGPVLRLRVRQGTVLALVLLATISCEKGGRPAAPADRSGPMTETDYVEYMAALTVALEEGRSGEDASARITELGATPFPREKVEAFVATLREDPERWAEITLKVDRRIAEQKAKGRSSP
jgi:hypothetical protein